MVKKAVKKVAKRQYNRKPYAMPDPVVKPVRGKRKGVTLDDVVKQARAEGATVEINIQPLPLPLSITGAEPKLDFGLQKRDLKVDNVMTQAEAIIYGDREKTYGHPALNLETIAQLWTVYIRRKAAVEQAKFELAFGEIEVRADHMVPTISIDDVCQMMVLLKSARMLNDPGHHDSQVDQIGYIALQERCRVGQ